jgi:two-component system, cell cycle response regulator
MSIERVVLVAEDSLVVRALLRAQLREHGYTVVEAADGEQALQRARESAPDVILLDVEMPRMDGFEVLAELKRDPALLDVPVIFITGRTTADDAVRGLESGAHDYLRKPFEASELAARVHAAIRTKVLQDELREVNVELSRQATTDALTGLPNRRFLDEQLTRLVSRSARHDLPLAALLIDADRFKAVNDVHGHAAGDRALVTFGRRLARRLRKEDVLGRWGGEEFLVLASDIEPDGAVVLAEALRHVVSATPIPVEGGEVTITASVGVAVWHGDDADGVLRRADAALYRAKAAGRDRVEIER